MSDGSKAIAGILVMVFLVLFGVIMTASVWNECRAGGNSLLYCMRLVSK